MTDAVSCVVRAASRRQDEVLNVVTAVTHERWQSYLGTLPCRFWLVRGPGGFKERWDGRYATLPANHVVLPPCGGEVSLPPDVTPDLVVAQHRFGQYQAFKPLADRLQVPLLVVEHTLPRPEWGENDLAAIRLMRGDANAFITRESRAAWGWGDEAAVVEHGVDTDLFRPGGPRHAAVVAVANDYVNRGDVLGFDVWREATRGMPVRPLGDTPGLSEAPASVEDLAAELAAGSVFACTARSSPIPMSLLEAMAAGMACVCIRQSAVASVVEHGVNGLLADDAAGFRAHLMAVRADPGLRARLGGAARETVLRRFPLEKFRAAWLDLFRKTADMIHLT